MRFSMLAAFLTTLFFTLSAIAARRSIEYLGSQMANLWRLLVAALLLGLWAFFRGQGWCSAAFGWFLLSGMIGFGLGDIGVFQALPRIGSRLTLLLTQCLAAPLAGLVEWLWLGVAPSALECGFGAVILTGVTLALREERKPLPTISAPQFGLGVFFGLLAAAGQGLGAVISRKAYSIISFLGQSMDGGTAAFQRILGGIVVAGLACLILNKQPPENPPTPSLRNKIALLVLSNALCGPVLGVSFYQWSLATVPSALVLPIVALTPIVAIPFAFYFEGDRPSARSLAGGFLAVLAAGGLAWSRTV